MTEPITAVEARRRLSVRAVAALAILALLAALALLTGAARYVRSAAAVQGIALTLTEVQPALDGDRPVALAHFSLHNGSPLPLWVEAGVFALAANGGQAGDSSRAFWGTDPASDPGPLQRAPLLPVGQAIGPGQTLAWTLTLHLIPAHVATIRQAQQAGPVVWSLRAALDVVPAFASDTVPLNLSARWETGS